VSPRIRSAPSTPRNRRSPAPGAQLVEIRAEFRRAITKLKALGCEDSVALVEFWHALDRVNSRDRGDL
jgi:hypothetical protein